MGADDAAADTTVRRLVEQQLGEALVAAIGDGAARRGPREHRFTVLDALGLALLLGLACPGDLRIGVGHRRNLARVEIGVVTSGGLRRHMRLMHRLVGQHGLADDVADGEDVRDIGAHLVVHRDEPPVGHRHAGLLGGDLPAVRAAPHRHQHQIVDLRLRWRLLAFEADPDALGCGLGGHGFGLQHDLVKAVGVHLLPHLDQIPVGAEHHVVEHFYYVDAGAERGVDGGHLQADDARAHHQHALRNSRQLQRAGRVDDARVLWHEGQLHGLRTGGDDRLLEAHDFFSPGLVLAVALGQLDFEMVRIEKPAHAAHHFDLARLGHARESTSQFPDHAFLEAAQLVDVHLWRAKLDAVARHDLDLIHRRRGMQQRLRRDATDIQAHAAQRGVTFHQHRLHAEIGGTKGGGITARSRAEHQHLAVHIGVARISASGRRDHGRGGGRRRGGGGRHGLHAGALLRIEHQNQRAFGHLVADLDLDLLDHASARRRHVHGGLVGFQRDQRILDLDRIARLDQYLDDGHVLEITDIGNLDFDEVCHRSFSLRSGRAASRRAGWRNGR